MNFLTITAVKKAFSTEEVNKLLREEWRLIHIHSVTDSYGGVMQTYTLGRFSEEKIITHC